jgi:predicted nuclease of restriction endonuclease-like (RecB) superfamily
MKRQRRAARPVARAKPSGLGTLVSEVRDLVQAARRSAVSVVISLQVLTNFEIGRRIVEHEQQGAKRAGYGTALLKELSARLTEEFGKGFPRTNLEYMRKFFLTWQDRVPMISQAPVGKSGQRGISQQPIGKSSWMKKSQTVPFTLSWIHYLVLLSINDPDERRFYEIEATNEAWSVPELKRQKASCLYERLALSRDKTGVMRLAQEGQAITRPEDMLKEPFVLEFLGLGEKSKYSESDLESALIDHLEHFLLELGKGFLFEARQKRFTFDGDHYFLDLVFYNRLLRCYVLVDLKLDKLTHQDLGQMQMYVNFYDRKVRTKEENSTIGIVLCKQKKKALVEMTLPKDANIHTREYQLYLPGKEELRQKLVEWSEEAEARHP